MIRALAGAFLALACLAGCASDEAIVPYRGPSIELVCIKSNPDVPVPQFVAELRRQLGDRGIRTIEYQAAAPAECRYRLLYWTDMRWDAEKYLRFAALRLYDGSRLVAQSSYDDRFGAPLARYRATRDKIAFLLRELLPR